MTTNLNLPPEKFVNHVLKTAADLNADTENIRAVIEAVWVKTRTQVEPKTVNDVVLDYVASSEALEAKVQRVRRVIANTLRKRNLSVPPEFSWTSYGQGGVTVKGVYRKKTAFGKELTKVKDTNSAPDNFFVVVELNSVFGKQSTANIPVQWFSFSDGELSKMVRHRVRAIARENENREIGELKKQRAAKERELQKLDSQLEQAIAAAKKR